MTGKKHRALVLGCQVAAGVLAGWSQLGKQKGIHFVEDLDHQQFVGVASEVLGPPVIVHDPVASPRLLADRRVISPRPA